MNNDHLAKAIKFHTKADGVSDARIAGSPPRIRSPLPPTVTQQGISVTDGQPVVQRAFIRISPCVSVPRNRRVSL